jgi:hypothetical protein
VLLGNPPYHILGLDFTSAPRRAKPITVAHGVLDASGCLCFEQVEALTDFAADPATARVRDALGLDGFVVLPEGAYDAVTALEREAAALGYPVLG